MHSSLGPCFFIKPMQSLIQQLINNFEPIHLSEMSGIRLMNRTDTKFVTTLPRLVEFLQQTYSSYRVQEVDGQRIARYYTVYFDTPHMDMYLMHEVGHANRQKLRIRSYVDSHLSFLEVKSKNNHGKTDKQRVDMQEFDALHPNHDIVFDGSQSELLPQEKFVRGSLQSGLNELSEKLENRFYRITLVNKQLTERLTIDMDMRFHNLVTGEECHLPNIVVIELKRDGYRDSQVLHILNNMRIHRMGFSKYAFGSALTNSSLRQNRLKSRLHHIQLMNQN